MLANLIRFCLDFFCANQDLEAFISSHGGVTYVTLLMVFSSVEIWLAMPYLEVTKEETSKMECPMNCKLLAEIGYLRQNTQL